jgi:hypothetical protein
MSMEDPERDLMMLAFYDPVRWSVPTPPDYGYRQHNLRTNLNGVPEVDAIM